MTRDEAIAHGKEQLEIFGGTHREFILMAIEALERKHGEWIIEEEGLYSDSLYTAYCSNCRHYVNWFEDNYGSSIIRDLPNYCSNCGADMRNILPKP